MRERERKRRPLRNKRRILFAQVVVDVCSLVLFCSFTIYVCITKRVPAQTTWRKNKKKNIQKHTNLRDCIKTLTCVSFHRAVLSWIALSVCNGNRKFIDITLRQTGKQAAIIIIVAVVVGKLHFVKYKLVAHYYVLVLLLLMLFMMENRLFRWL